MYICIIPFVLFYWILINAFVKYIDPRVDLCMRNRWVSKWKDYMVKEQNSLQTENIQLLIKLSADGDS